MQALHIRTGLALVLLFPSLLAVPKEPSDPVMVLPIGPAMEKRRAQAGEMLCRVKGVVVLAPGQTSDSLDFFLQDETGGLRVNTRGATDLKVGDEIAVTGELKLYPSAEIRLKAEEIEKLGRKPPPKPAPATVNEVWAGKHLGRLVVVAGTVVRSTYSRPNYSVYLGPGVNNPRAYRPVKRGETTILSGLLPGTEITVTGIVCVRSSNDRFEGYQIRLRNDDDVVIQQQVAVIKERHLEWIAAGIALFALAGTAWIWTLRKMIRRKTRQVEELLVEARDASRAKSEFLANMSHEIRTPMNGVLGMTDLLLESGLDPAQRDYAATIKSSGETLLAVLNDVLDFSKIEAGKLEVEDVPAPLAATVEDTVALFTSRAQEKGLELTCLIHEEVPAIVRGDPVRIRQVLSNLIGNAIKFTDRGEVGVEVMLEREDARRAEIQFLVRDTGIGIAPEMLPKLFESFVQGETSTSRHFGGTGLGLAISKRLVEAMGGIIQAESEPGQGSTFRVTLPFGKAEALAASGPGLRASLEGLRILVVDDNPTNRRILTYYLRRMGCRSSEAESGAAALEMLREAEGQGDPFRVALLDMVMPDMDAIETSRRIQKSALRTAPKMLCLTSAPRQGDAARLRAVGFSGYLLKPVRQARLGDAIAAAVCLAPPAGPASRPGRRANTERRQLRLLVAEDNAVNQRVVLRALERSGYAAEVVGDGEQAIQAFRNASFDLILMDVQMPGVDGFEATARIRAIEPAGERTPIVALTAHAMSGDRERCLEAGMDDYISKPIQLAQLQQVLARWLPEPVSSPAAGESDAGSYSQA